MQFSGNSIRRVVLEQSKRANIGHIGCSLSIADIVAALFYAGAKFTPEVDLWPNRDRFVLSKGHACLALYAALHLRGQISLDDLNSFAGDGTLLGVHPEYELPGVDFATGSLGQGLPMAAGAALAARMQNSTRRVFALLSDGECNEGAVWEAVMFAAHQQLSQLVVIIDLNGQQAFGHTAEVMNLDPLAEKWAAFGWDVHEVDGHDEVALQAIIAGLNTISGPPHVLLARTTFGKGVSFMQGQIKWHYWPMSQAEYAQAVAELEAAL